MGYLDCFIFFFIYIIYEDEIVSFVGKDKHGNFFIGHCKNESVSRYSFHVIPSLQLTQRSIDELNKAVKCSSSCSFLTTYIEVFIVDNNIVIVSEFVPQGNPADFINFLSQQTIPNREMV
jgi:hypothetical protein